MKLSQHLEGKRVKVVTVDDEVFEGKVTDYIFPEDNEPEGVAGVIMYKCAQCPGKWLGFDEPDIKSIEVID